MCYFYLGIQHVYKSSGMIVLDRQFSSFCEAVVCVRRMCTVVEKRLFPSWLCCCDFRFRSNRDPASQKLVQCKTSVPQNLQQLSLGINLTIIGSSVGRISASLSGSPPGYISQTTLAPRPQKGTVQHFVKKIYKKSPTRTTHLDHVPSDRNCQIL